METKVCGKCRQEKPVSEFYKSKRDGYGSWCKNCKRDYKREYYKRPGAKEAQRKLYERLRDEGYFRQYWRKQKQDPRLQVRLFARRYVSNMIRMGKLIRQSCAECGKEQGEAHHPDYNEPLLIVWLCPDCHRALHRRLKVKKGEGNETTI